MKRLLYILLLFLMLIPLKVNADSATVTLNCTPSAISRNETFDCTVVIDSPQVVTSIQGTLSFNSSLVEYSTTPTVGLTGNNLSITDVGGLANGSPVTTIHLKIKSDATESTTTDPNVTVSLTNISVETSTPVTLNPSDASSSVRVKSSNNSLASLSIDASNITLTSATSYSYANGGASNANILWTKNHPNQIVTMSFRGNTVVGSTVTGLEYGPNSVIIVVTPETGSAKTYTLNVNRLDDRSKNTYLKLLEISYGVLSFDKEVLEYTLTVPFEINNVIIAKETEETSAIAEVTGGKDMIVGENTILITVTAQNGDKKEYKIIVTRQEKNAPAPSDNMYLSKLIVKNHAFEFSKYIFNYSITISNKVKKLSITTSTEDDKANYKILNNENLTNGSKVKIRVTAQSGVTIDYVLNIKVKNSLDLPLIIAIGTLTLGIVIIIIIIILRNKNNKMKKEVVTITEDTATSNQDMVISEEVPVEPTADQEEVPILEEFPTQQIFFTNKE